MRIALIGDIHSNQFALEAVLEQLKNDNIDSIFFLGDYAFGGSGSVEVVDRLIEYKTHPYIAIKGNKEGYINGIEQRAELNPILPFIYNELGMERINFLKSLPDEVHVEFEGVKFRICHNPSKLKMFVITDRLHRKGTVPNYDTLHILAAEMQDDICIYGHYHMFMDEVVDRKRFICACSVGLPFDADSNAKYLIMNIKNKIVSIEKKSVFYDRSKLVDDFEKKGYFERFSQWSMNTIISMMTGCNYIGTQDLRRN
ncbi:MAG: metallophosphoesterase family protein [Oscillospiraceae bacterium]